MIFNFKWYDMKELKYILMAMVAGWIIWGCDDNYYHDSGLANGKHDCSMWEYLHTDGRDWDSTVVMIERAGLRSLFDGGDSENGEITFFGPTNYSIMQFLYKTLDDVGEVMYERIADIPVEMCRQMILSHVIRGKKMSTDFDFEVKGTLTGGSVETTLTGRQLRVYRVRGEYNGIPDIGPEGLMIHALEGGHIAGVASSNIETTNGVVHSLSYTHQLTELY